MHGEGEGPIKTPVDSGDGGQKLAKSFIYMAPK